MPNLHLNDAKNYCPKRVLSRVNFLKPNDTYLGTPEGPHPLMGIRKSKFNAVFNYNPTSLND